MVNGNPIFRKSISTFHGLERTGVHVFGQRWRKLYQYRKSCNEEIKRKLSTENFQGWYIVGHSHLAEFDQQARFINLGDVMYGQGTYLDVDTDLKTLTLKSAPFT